MVITFSILTNDKTVPLISILLIDKISNIPFKISLAPSPHFFLSSKSWANQANWMERKRKVGIIFLAFKRRTSVNSHTYIYTSYAFFLMVVNYFSKSSVLLHFTFSFSGSLRELTKLSQLPQVCLWKTLKAFYFARITSTHWILKQSGTCQL